MAPRGFGAGKKSFVGPALDRGNGNFKIAAAFWLLRNSSLMLVPLLEESPVVLRKARRVGLQGCEPSK